MQTPPYKAKASMMAAVINNDTCFECIGPNTKATLGDFLDGCGQCRNLNLPCVCPK